MLFTQYSPAPAVDCPPPLCYTDFAKQQGDHGRVPMEFTFETDYNSQALEAMAKVLRKTIRKKRSRLSHIFGWLIIAAAILLTLPPSGEALTVDFRAVITWLMAAALLFVLLFEDKLNGYIARKRMLAGMERATTVFSDEGYVTTTNMGKTEFPYDRNISLVAETKDYFVFIFDKSHAQVYDKRTLSGGSVQGFREMLAEKTGKELVPMT